MKARILGLMTTGTVLALATGASAQDTLPSASTTKAIYQAAVVNVVAPAVAEKYGRNLLEDPNPEMAGSGTEGSVTGIHVDAATGKQYLVAVYMASADRTKHPKGAQMTLRCASMEFQEKEAPKLIADNEIQAEEGRRTAHRPAMPERADSKGRFLVAYGNDRNQNSPSTYVKVVDHKCNVLSSPVRVSLDYMFDDANSGGAGYMFPYKAANGQTRYIGNYLATNSNKDYTAPDNPSVTDDDKSYAFNITINDDNTVTQEWPGVDASAVDMYTSTDNNVNPPVTTQHPIPSRTSPRAIGVMTDIARGSRLVSMIDDNRFVQCYPWGNDRPSNHIECAVVETNTGKVLWRDYVLKGDQESALMKYWNQSVISKLGPNRIALSAISVNGAGKNTDIKGVGKSWVFVYDIVGDALVKVAEAQNAAVHAPHSALCTGMRGVDGQEKSTIFVVSAPHSGVGRSAGTMVTFDDVARTLKWDDRKDKVPTAFYADGQLLANYYGDNPMEQGRDFPKCMGDVPNPSYGKEGGWMKDSKSFFVTGVHGREPGFARNAFWVSFVPAVTKTAVDHFSSPANANEAAVTPTSNDPTPAPAPAKAGSSGCGCSTPGQTNSSNFAGGLLLLGLAIGGIAARRRS